MKAVPVLKSSDLEASVAFYTGILGFKETYPDWREQSLTNGVMNLSLEGAELQLSIHAGDGAFGSNTRIYVASAAELNDLFAGFVANGLNNSAKPDSPVHQGPVDQTWGLREFSVSAPDGHGLNFCAPLCTAN